MFLLESYKLILELARNNAIMLKKNLFKIIQIFSFFQNPSIFCNFPKREFKVVLLLLDL